MCSHLAKRLRERKMLVILHPFSGLCAINMHAGKHLVSLSLLCGLVCAGHAPAGDRVVLPLDANVVNVKHAPFNAVGDGTNDDTKAISEAVSGRGRRTVYFPDGCYLISGPVQIVGNHVLQGESRDGAVIRVKDGATAFNNADSAMPVITTCGRIRSIRNMTINTGSGNPGATGVRFMTEKGGAIRDCVIVSADGTGRTGLDLAFPPADGHEESNGGTNMASASVSGVCMVERVMVSGFSEGVSVSGNGDSVVLEDVTLENIRGRGIVNNGACLAVRCLRGGTPAAAVDNASPMAVTALVDINLEGSLVSEKSPAVVNNGILFARRLSVKNYALAIQNNNGDAKDEPGPKMEQWVSHCSGIITGAQKLVGLEIKDIPEAPWQPPDKWISVTQFPPREVEIPVDGARMKALDYTESLQLAIDSGKQVVYFPPGISNYFIGGTVHIREKVERIIGFRAHFLPTRRTSGEAFRATLIVDEGVAPVVVLEDFDWAGANVDIEHYARDLVLRDISGGGRYSAREDAGALFAENVMMPPMSFISGQSVWARQVFIDSTVEAKLVNEGARVWVLGLKAENQASLAVTRMGGLTEIIGAVACAYTPQPKHPMFIVESSSSAFSCCAAGEWTRSATDAPYTSLVTAKNRNSVRLLERGNVPLRADPNAASSTTGNAGSVIPFFRVSRDR